MLEQGVRSEFEGKEGPETCGMLDKRHRKKGFLNGPCGYDMKVEALRYRASSG